MTDFTNGLTNASEYLNRTTLSIPTSIDIGLGGVTAQSTSFSLKELICALLAGNGINLPNFQICLKINLARLLGISGLPPELMNALKGAEAALDKFIAHTNIDNALARLNSMIADFAAIANMINFCGTPVIPRAIPNVLADAMGSFIGKGYDLLNKLGSMLDTDIGGCIGGNNKFNANVFSGGLLKQIGDNLDDIANMPQTVIDQITNDLNAFASDLENLIEFENNYSSVDTKGGSTFNPGANNTIDPITGNPIVFTGVGAALDADNMTFAQGANLASNIQSLYTQLSAYEVEDRTDPDVPGRNIFDFLLTDDMIANLKQETLPTVPLASRDPVYDYCGKIIGYTERSTQSISSSSNGAPVEDNITPASVGLQESGTVVNPPPSSTTNLTNTSVVLNNVPSSPIGKAGDTKGSIASDGAYMYLASADFDGQSLIWSRAQLSNW